MATNGAQQVFAPVLAAHSTMSSGADRTQKEQAHQYLEQFQKSVWHQRIGQWSSVG
jgi:transportin-3